MFMCKEMIIKICTVFFILQDSLVSGSEDGVRVVGNWDLKKMYPTDYFENKEIHVVDYCEIPHCPKGSHIVCETFNPTAQFGGKCMGTRKDIRMTPWYAQIILDNFNRARGEVAMGRARGKRNVEFPRAYGMMKLKWDSELATFAQLLANKCTVVYDHCRSTKRFENPSQTTCAVHFNLDNWHPLINSNNHTFDDGYDEAKLIHAIEEAYLHDYHYRKTVTLNMIENIPNWKKPTALSTSSEIRHALYYLHLIHSNVSHVGCGISTYVSSATNSNEPVPVVVNTILLVCNLSHQPSVGGKAYDVDPPVRKKRTIIGKSVCTSKAHCTALYKEEELNHPFSKCGCPEGTIEDENCLCEHSLDESKYEFKYGEKKMLFQQSNEADMKHDWDPHKAFRYNQGNGESYEEKKDCNTAVLLPIITEDGTNIQPEELASYFMSNTKSTEMKDGYIARTRHVRPRHRYRQRKNRVMNSHRRIPSQRHSYSNDSVPAESVPEIIENHENQQDWSSKRRTQLRKKNRQSIFARARKFHLPVSKYKTNIRTQNVTTRKDLLHTKQFVNPQRDESVMESKASLVTSFVNKDKHSKLSELSDIYEMFNSTNEPTENHEYQMQNKTPADFVSPSKLNNINRASNEKYSNEEPHKNSKLLHLINIIEKEIKKSKLNSTEKEKIHTKIKQILYSLHEDSNVPDDVKILRDSITMHNVKENLNNRNDYMIEADAEYDINKDQLPKRHHQSLLTKEPSFFMPIDERETRPFVLPVDFSEGELIAKDKESEEVISNDEYVYKKTLEPEIDYKTEIDDEKNKETEIINTRYRKQNTEDNDEIYTKRFLDDNNKYNEYKKDNIKSNHGYDYISNSDFADNDRFKHRYERNYTALDYGEDLLDEERRDYYQKKLVEMRNKQRNSNQENLQNQPVLMQRRLKNLAVSRAQAARFYEPDQDRFIQGY